MHRKAMKTWYVYAHYNLNTNELFCIGVGTGKRAYNKNRNQLWKNIVVKHGYRVEMLRTGFTNRDEAVKVEIRLQQLNKPRACFQYGDRLNSIQSQETKDKRAKALTGKKRSKETKQLLSSQKMGKLNPMYKKEVSQETRDKYSAYHNGRDMTEEHKLKIRESNAKTLGKSIVNCRGDIYPTLRAAANTFCPKNISGISRALKTGRTAGNYEDGTKVRWSYHVNS